MKKVIELEPGWFYHHTNNGIHLTNNKQEAKTYSSERYARLGLYAIRRYSIFPKAKIVNI